MSFISGQQDIVGDTFATLQSKLTELKTESEQSRNLAVSAKVQIEGVHDEYMKLLNDKLRKIENQYDDEIKTKVEELNKYVNKLQNIILDWEQKQNQEGKNSADGKEELK